MRVETQDVPVPSVWLPEYVGLRLIEALKTLHAIPMRLWPKEFGNAWPAYKHVVERFDENAREIGVSWDDKQARQAEQNRSRVPPTAHEITRMEEALAWPMRYLQDEDPVVGRTMMRWALIRSQGRSVRRYCRVAGMSHSTFHRQLKLALTSIAARLREDREPVL